jgi:glycosyltransferase involved in cell wall biosynthesis
MSNEVPEFSVIITCFNEERSVAEFHARLRRVLDGLGTTSEIVMVDDGSADGTWAKLLELHAQDPELTVLDLFRNAGQCAAISAGIQEARGRHFVFMDSDLQLDPEDLPGLVKVFREGCDVVNGIRRERRDPWSRRLASWIANAALRRLAGLRFGDFGCSFQVMRGELVRAHGFGPERPFHNVLVSRSAGRFREVPVSHRDRPHGSSGWTARTLGSYLLDHVVLLEQGAFLRLGAVALLLVAALAVRIVLFPGLGAEVSNARLLDAILLCAALLAAALAWVGEYARRGFAGGARGPLYVVRERRPSARRGAGAAQR